MSVVKKLLPLAEEGYRNFSASLIPTVDKTFILGVRVPLLRKLIKSLAAEEKEHFLSELPHAYHEENVLHALLLSDIKDPKDCMDKTEAFLPFVDNWAVCDSLRPKCFPKDRSLLLTHIETWLISDRTYTVRFGMEMLMLHFLGEAFEPRYLDMVANTRGGEYYVDMMAAWFFATALTVRYEEALPYIETYQLSPWTHTKTIQKALDSLQIPRERKEYLKSLRCGRKENL